MTRTARAFAVLFPALCALTTPVVAQSDPSLFDLVINLPEDLPSLAGPLGSNTQVNVHAGGKLESGFIAGPEDGSGANIEINVLGGIVGSGFRAVAGSTLNVNEGTVRLHCRAQAGGTINISGGSIAPTLYVESGAKLRITGGVFKASSNYTFDSIEIQTAGSAEISGGEFLDFRRSPIVCEGTLAITGGRFESKIIGQNGGMVIVSGGRTREIKMDAESTLVLHGTRFERNNVPITTDTVQPELRDEITCVLADGTVAAWGANGTGFSPRGSPIALVEMAPTPPDLSPIEVAAGTLDFFSIRDGQSLTLSGDVFVPYGFQVENATLVVSENAEVEGQLRTESSIIELRGGKVWGASLHHDSVVRVLGPGASGYNHLYRSSAASMEGPDSRGTFHLRDDSTLRIDDGVASYVYLYDASSLTISNGRVRSGLEMSPGTRADIDGGVLPRFLAIRGGTLNLRLHELTIDGLRVFGQPFNTPIDISGRNILLGGRFVNGQSLDLYLDSDPRAERFISQSATITVTLVPCPADTNFDGVVDLGDIVTFVELYLAMDPASDLNGDSELDTADLKAFVTEFVSGC